MKWLKYFLVLMLMVQIKPNMAQTPEYYQEVDRVVWIVQDLQGVMKGWRSLGFTNMQDHGMVTLSNRLSGNLEVYMASANLGGDRITWIQPVTKNNPFSNFLSTTGDGAFSLMHRFSSVDEMQKEIQRLKNLGIDLLLEGNVAADEGTVYYAFMDTQQEGKYVLGLISGPDDMEYLNGGNQLGMKFTQYAFAIADPDPVSSFWA